MNNLDIFAQMNGLTEKLVETVGQAKAEAIKDEEIQQMPPMNIEQLLAQAPRKLRRKLQPHKKFSNQLKAAAQNKNKK